ncbi:MAG: hypothetical protein LQ338_004979 [Usnochroma carphineum]|nr:MAG: hypothetical protein LQ338_004979 [Usnochroma carphineum]
MKMFHRFRRKKAEPLVIPTIIETLPQSPHQQEKEHFSNAPDIHRNATTTSNLSSYAILADQAKDDKLEARRRERSIERHADPMGLNVVYAPKEGVPTADIILVHGLGGTSQKTWSRNRDAQLFWPREWLPSEPGFGQARILSFGYNAHFASSGRENIMNIADFAKDLLFGMKYGLDQNSEELEIGKVPIIFVVHSMGGLVVKKAFILGQNDTQYRQTIVSTCAILFLSTPHRGTNLAELLNRILTVSVFNHSAKQYIAELKQNSPALQDINEQFRNIAPRMQIFSFFETHQTAVGPKRMMVLEKDSSILGYPDEVSKPLDADHHNDPNYVSVRNALRSVLRRVSTSDTAVQAPVSNEVDMSRIKTVLATSGAPEDDYGFFRSRWMPGSCEWVLQCPAFHSWLEGDPNLSRILWVHGVPGCGKSILSAFLIGHLQDAGYSCQYFFFRFGDSSKKTVNSLLRSLAYQIAFQTPQLRAEMQKLADDAVRFEKAESRIIWQKVFATRLCRLRLGKPLYWIIDALDECESPQLLLSLLSSICSSKVALRIMLVGRKTDTLSTALQRLEISTPVDAVSADETKGDLELYVAREVRFMRGNPQFKARVVQSVCERAQGNFLWVHLVLKEILQCHTEDAIEQALEELPPDLEPLYHRMQTTLSNASRPSDRDLSKIIFTWVICSQRALSLEELSEALKPEYSHVLDLQLTISQVCGDFVVIDNQSRVNMVHQTAREYLIQTPGLEHSITPRIGHQELFMRCIGYLSRPNRRLRTERPMTQPFLQYAATSWPFHLGSSAASLDHSVLLALANFFQSTYLLDWISLLAATDYMRTLIYASQGITSYLGKKSRVDAESSPLTDPLHEKEMLELWAVDLVKIIGKFGAQLMRHPKSIYTLVPTFCPKTTMIFQRCKDTRASHSITVTGSHQKWDDCLSKFYVGRDCQSLKITCMDRYFLILTSDGILRLYETSTSQPWQRIVHGERILCFRFSASHEKCVTYGLRETKIWLVKQRRQLHSIANPPRAKALDVAFRNDDSAIVSCSDDKRIRRCELGDTEPTWHIVDGDRAFDSTNSNSYNSPRRVAFNAAGTQVAVSFRGFPLLVWDVEIGEIIGRCERASDRNKNRQDLYTDVGPICWNSVTGHVLGLYNDGCVFKWHPLESSSHEARSSETGISCSPHGALFVTSNSEGMLKVWNFYHLAIIYQLSCHSPVTDMALSPDGRRIYDLRESFCNVWEPNALIRMAEADERSSETSSTMAGSTQLSLASEGPAEASEPLTALAVGPQTSCYCSGDDVGVVRLSCSNGGTPSRVSQGFMPVDYIVWSDDEHYLATADLGGRLNVRLKVPSGDSNLVARYPLLFEAKTGNSLRQILFSHSAEYLLIATTGFTELWSLKTKNMLNTRPNTSPSSRWINHPSESSLLVQCTLADVRLLQWSDLVEVACLPLEHKFPEAVPESESESDPSRRPSSSFPLSRNEDYDAVDEVFVSSTGSHLLIQISSPRGQRPRVSAFLELDTHDLSASSVSGNTAIVVKELPFHISKNIARILGFARSNHRRPSYGQLSEAALEPEDALVFMDHDDWICSFAFGSDVPRNTKIMRHFFLPQDWLGLDSLRLASISKDGKFYCPKNGEVAVVTNWLNSEWID